ncbi:MAG TPA: preprotein translocase subunit SecY [Desulfonatronum sp.]|nr:preprotein translocase subunit SecY [Desulfonatronum sp.]
MQQTTSKSGGLAELKRKVLFTFLLLATCRVGIHIPVPGVDSQAMSDFFASMKSTLFGLFDMFAGGGLSNLSIFALGIMPYISASIIIQLLTVVSPELKRLSKEEGAAGRKKITQYTRYGTVLIAAIQGFGIAIGIENMSSPTGVPVVMAAGWAFRATTIMTLVSGTVLLMWLGEQITEYGIGNGISLIIFAGIVAQLPGAIINTFRLMGAGQISLFVALLLAILVAGVLVFIVFMERGQRRIPIQYAKRMLGRKMYGGQTTHLPLKINTAGVIPPIFASSILMFPATLATFSQSDWLSRFSAMFDPSTVLYNVVFVALIIFFCYFYTAIIFDPKDIAENIRKQGGFIPGIRPGLRTREYIDKVLTRITLWGSLYISAICVLPMVLISQFNVPFYFGGTGVLIAVVVAMDTMSKVDSYLITHQYEGLMQKTRIKGRR